MFLYNIFDVTFRGLLFIVKVKKESPETLVERFFVAVVILLFSKNAAFLYCCYVLLGDV